MQILSHPHNSLTFLLVITNRRTEKLSSPPHCHQCSPVSPAAQQRCCTSGTQLPPRGRGPMAAQVTTERAEGGAERGRWIGPLAVAAPVRAKKHVDKRQLMFLYNKISSDIC